MRQPCAAATPPRLATFSGAQVCPSAAGSPALHALCTDSSVYERLCSARAAKGDSLHDLLAAGRAAVLLPPGQRLFASGNTFLDDIRCDCQRSNSRDRTSTLALCTSTRGHRTTVHHCLQCWSFAHFRSAYRLRWAPAAAVAATVERLAACVWMCVRVCVHCGQLEPAVPPEKTALNFVENSANASQNAIFFWRCAAPTLGGTPRKKVEIPRQKVRSREFDIFLRKKPDGKAFM